MSVSILIGDCRERMKELPDASVDSVVCDPPYHLTSQDKRGPRLRVMKKNGDGSDRTAQRNFKERGFMGQTWDGGDVAFQPETWAEVLRVLKPGGHLVAFSGTRTYHRMAVAIEDAGFEIRDQLAWVYGSGFPKSHDVSKAIDKAAGAEREVLGYANRKMTNSVLSRAKQAQHGYRPEGGEYANEGSGGVFTAPATDSAKQWQGWGTALKPSWEPICLARKPLIGSVAANVLAHGTGALNIDGCRIEGEPWKAHTATGLASEKFFTKGEAKLVEKSPHDLGRWPANLCHDGSDEVMAGFPDASGGGRINGERGTRPGGFGNIGADKGSSAPNGPMYEDDGSAARFFFEAKYNEDELLFCRAKAMLSAWTNELANSAEGSSGLPESHAVFALRLAATLALPEGRRLSALTGLSTAATPTELNNLATNFIAAILSFESGCLPAWLQGKPTLSDSPAPLAAIPAPTDTITITISHWKSSGCAEPVTFSITPLNSEPGAKDLAPARFKYCAKATTEERGEGNNHPTVKPVALMRWLVRLITPPGGTVLDPFMGSGSTGLACQAEQFNFIGCEMSAEYAAIAERRLRDDAGMFADVKVAA